MPHDEEQSSGDTHDRTRHRTASLFEAAREQQTDDAHAQPDRDPCGSVPSPAHHQGHQAETHRDKGQGPLRLMTQKRTQAQDSERSWKGCTHRTVCGADPTGHRSQPIHHVAPGARQRPLAHSSTLSSDQAIMLRRFGQSLAGCGSSFEVLIGCRVVLQLNCIRL